jgi:hypothetical protein
MLMQRHEGGVKREEVGKGCLAWEVSISHTQEDEMIGRGEVVEHVLIIQIRAAGGSRRDLLEKNATYEREVTANTVCSHLTQDVNTAADKAVYDGHEGEGRR